MQSGGEKTISILLTRNTDIRTRILRLLTGGKYTHASIGIEGDRNRFYSFVTKGFCAEKPWIFTQNKKKTCALYQISVTDETYEIIKSRLDEFKRDKTDYQYSFLGALLCYLRVPHHFKNRYFCSQFVAELLSMSGELQLKKSSSLYNPNDFEREPQLALCFQGRLGELATAI